MSNSPVKLIEHRRRFMALTGITNPASVGISADASHRATGGYHCGRDDLVAIGRFHATRQPGDPREDYSARQARDRAALDNFASAVDWGYEWPRGGNAAWLRFNRMLFDELRAGHLPALRAINFTLDGAAKHRYDTANAAQGVIASADTVTVHTHGEFWRDTLASAELDETLTHIEALVEAAIANRPAPAALTAAEIGDDDMRALIRYSSSPAVFLTDGVTARWVVSEDELADLRTLSNEGTLPLAKGGAVRVVGRKSLIGRVVGPCPPDMADIAEDVK